MDSRQQFVQWQCEADDGPQVDPMWMMYDEETNTFGLDLIQRDWKVWQASRSEIVIDMPRSFSEDRYFRDVYEVEDVHDVIHTAGIRTK